MDGELVEGDSIAGVQNSFEKVVDDLSNLCMLVRGELTKLMRGSLVALITIDVHNRDIVEYLINDKTENKSDFNWQVAVHPCA
jgi:dynein heavy chain